MNRVVPRKEDGGIVGESEGGIVGGTGGVTGGFGGVTGGAGGRGSLGELPPPPPPQADKNEIINVNSR